MIQQGSSRKILIGIIIALLVVLGGISIFVASRLAQEGVSQAPTDSSAGTCGDWICTSCGCGCQDYFQNPARSNSCCMTSSNNYGLPVCQTGGDTPARCEINHVDGHTITFSSACAGNVIKKYSTSYDGGKTKCPTNENGTIIGTVPPNGGQYTATADPGTCVQIDHEFGGIMNGAEIGPGGLCTCTPPLQVAQCNQACSSAVQCASGLSCTSGVCRLPANPTSPTCTPTTPTVSATSVCPAGSTSPTATITWSGTTVPTSVDIDNDNNWNNGYWKKGNGTVATLSGTSTTAPSGFESTAGASGTLILNSNSTYYVRAFYASGAITTQTVTFNAAQCTVVVVAQCIDLQENGSDPTASGVGNFIEYTLIYQNNSAGNPYPNIKLRVGTSSTPVGRNANVTTSSLVTPYSSTFDSVTSRWTYRFRWEAIGTNGTTQVPAGTHNVRVLLDGTTEVTTPAACIETLTVSQTATPQPLFTIAKVGAPVCENNGDFLINYTITVTNIGSVSGTIDFIEDAYDTQANSLGIVPTGIDPAFGIVNGGKIRWTGDVAQRTFTSNQSKQYKYQMRIPTSQLTNFVSSGVLNQAVVQYDTATSIDNTASFDLRTPLTCSLPSIPNTAIGDDVRFILIGIIFIMAGILVYKFRIGNGPMILVVGTVYDLFHGNFEKVKSNFRPYEESILDNIEKKKKTKKK